VLVERKALFTLLLGLELFGGKAARDHQQLLLAAVTELGFLRVEGAAGLAVHSRRAR